MKRSCSRLFRVLVCVALSACEPSYPLQVTTSQYPIKDSGVPAYQQGAVLWLDNQRVLFGELKGSGDSLEYDVVVWDTTTGKVSPYPALLDLHRVCVSGNFLSYIHRTSKDSRTWLLIYGKVRDGQIVENTVVPFRNQYQHPLSCRYYESPPPWVVKGRRTTPLLEEHGYLDWGPVDEKATDNSNSYLTLYRPGDPKGVPLSIRAKDLALTLFAHYAPFRNAYLLLTSGWYQEHRRNRPLLWLSLDGKITESEEAIDTLTMHGFVTTKAGLFVVSYGHLGNVIGDNYTQAGLDGVPIGAYLLKGKITDKLLTGTVNRKNGNGLALSPDSCKVAFVHDPYDIGTEENRRDRITVKLIDFCKSTNQTDIQRASAS